MSMKRVLIFATNYFPNVGGAEVAVREITDRISSKHMVFDLIAPRLSKRVPVFEKIGTVGVHRVGLGYSIDKWILPFTGFLKARSLDAKQPYDMLWAIMASQGAIAAAWYKKFHREKKLILTLQEGDEEEHLVRYAFGIRPLYRLFIQPFHRLPFRHADLITAISTYLKTRAQETGTSAPIVIVPNAANVELFSESCTDEELQQATVRMGKKPGDYIIITTSRLVKKNAVSDIIQSLVYLPMQTKLVVAGEGEEYQKLRSLAEVYGVASRVTFLGTVPNQDLPKYLKSSDVFVRPSLSEGFGVSFVEAMAAGIPVIATPVGGIVDFLKDNETGLFCTVKHPRSIADKIQFLKDNSSVRERIVKNARTMVERQYTWDSVARQMRQVFEKFEARNPKSETKANV